MEELSPKDQEILARYEASLVVPVMKPPKQFILCPVGLIGSGKSTVVKPLALKLSLLRISGDEVRQVLKADGLEFDDTYKIAFSLVKKYLKQGYSIAIDSDCVSVQTQELIKKAKKTFGVQIIWIHIATPESFILEHLRSDKNKQSWLFKDADDAVANYMRRKPLHDKLDMPFVYTFDISKPDLPDEIEKSLIAIRRALE